MTVLDWHSSYVVNWTLSDTLELAFVLDCARTALAQATPRIWNNDQGSHFTSPQYTDLLLAAGVQVSMDGRGRARDTRSVFTERLWRTVKYEEVYLNEYANPREAHFGTVKTHPVYPGWFIDLPAAVTYFAGFYDWPQVHRPSADDARPTHAQPSAFGTDRHDLGRTPGLSTSGPRQPA